MRRLVCMPWINRRVDMSTSHWTAWDRLGCALSGAIASVTNIVCDVGAARCGARTQSISGSSALNEQVTCRLTISDMQPTCSGIVPPCTRRRRRR
jgi:hypothetical protein